MKIGCLQENLARGLAIVGRAVSSRSPLPVLNNILLATDEGQLKLSATDLEIGINCWVGAQVEEEGALTVPARLIIEFVNSLPPERIDIELVARIQTLNLKCARVEANIKGIDASEFPVVPSPQQDQKICLPGELMREMVSQVSFAAATDESRPVMGGVLTKLEDRHLTMVAADGFRLSVRQAELEEEAEKLSIIIPARALNELSRVLGTGEGETVEVTVTPEQNQVLFHVRNVDLVSQLIEGTYPAYEQILPGRYETQVRIDRLTFLSAVRRASIFARDAANLLRLQIQNGEQGGPGRITLVASAVELGDNVDQVDAMVEGKDMEIAFSSRYLADMLEVMDTSHIVMETTSPTSPAVFKPADSESFLHVIMPMHIAR